MTDNYNPVYLYNHSQLFPVGASFRDSTVKVKPLSVRCHNVQPIGRNLVGTTSWIFQIVGDDVTWYTTAYDWSLIIDNPANIDQALACKSLQDDIEKLRRKREVEYTKIQNISIKDTVLK